MSPEAVEIQYLVQDRDVTLGQALVHNYGTEIGRVVAVRAVAEHSTLVTVRLNENHAWRPSDD